MSNIYVTKNPFHNVISRCGTGSAFDSLKGRLKKSKPEIEGSILANT